MPVTRGLQCAYCKQMFQSDYQMDIHLKTHKSEINEAKKFIENEEHRIRKNNG